MKICICRNITDTIFKDNLKNYEGEIVRTDFCSLEEFHMDCSGCGTQCGKCLSTIKDDIIEPHNKIVETVQAIAQENTPSATPTPHVIEKETV